MKYRVKTKNGSTKKKFFFQKEKKNLTEIRTHGDLLDNPRQYLDGWATTHSNFTWNQFKYAVLFTNYFCLQAEKY